MFTFIILDGHVLRSDVDQNHARQSRTQRAQPQLSTQLAHDLTLQFIESAELLAFEAHAVHANEPADQSTFRCFGVVRRALLDQVTLVPCSLGLLKLLQIHLPYFKKIKSFGLRYINIQ